MYIHILSAQTDNRKKVYPTIRGGGILVEIDLGGSFTYIHTHSFKNISDEKYKHTFGVEFVPQKTLINGS